MFWSFSALVPRTLLHVLAWSLLAFLLADVIAPIGAMVGFFASFLLSLFLEKQNLRLLWSLLILIAFPLVLRMLPAFLGLVLPGTDWLLVYDNTWLLMAPLYFASIVFLVLGHRYPRVVVLEFLSLLVLIAVLLISGDRWDRTWSIPVLATLRLTIGAGAVIIAAWGLWGNAPRIGVFLRPSSSRVSRLVHGTALVLVIVLLMGAVLRTRRAESIAQGGGILSNDLFRFDFSDVLNLEPEISLNAELALLYREDGLRQSRYLRRFTLSGWDDTRGFFRDGGRERDYPGAPIRPELLPRGPVELGEGSLRARERIRQEYYIVALDPSTFLSLEYPVVVEPWEIWDEASFVKAYAVESAVSVAGPWELLDSLSHGEDGLRMNDQDRLYFTQGGGDHLYGNLADEIAGGVSGDWEKAYAVERWLKENYFYSLRPGVAPDGDQLRWFLEDSRRGYCSYFAFAMTRICRAMGVPSRVAVGFATPEGSDILGFVPVGTERAHAWVEVWIDGYGWITFDPTSQTLAPGEEMPIQFVPPDDVIALIEEILSNSPELSLAVEIEEDVSSSPSWWREALSYARRRPWIPLLVFLGILFLIYLPGRILPGIRYRRDLRDSSHRRSILASWSLWRRRLTRSGWIPAAMETPREWARRMDSLGLKGFEDLERLAEKALYASELSAEDRRLAQDRVKELDRLWNNQAMGRRVRSWIAPDWPRKSP